MATLKSVSGSTLVGKAATSKSRNIAKDLVETFGTPESREEDRLKKADAAAERARKRAVQDQLDDISGNPRAPVVEKDDEETVFGKIMNIFYDPEEEEEEEDEAEIKTMPVTADTPPSKIKTMPVTPDTQAKTSTVDLEKRQKGLYNLIRLGEGAMAKTLQTLYTKGDEESLARVKKETNRNARLADTVLGAKDPIKALNVLYANNEVNGRSNEKIMQLSKLPPEQLEMELQRMLKKATAIEDITKAPEPFTLSAGQTRFDANNEPIAEGVPLKDIVAPTPLFKVPQGYMLKNKDDFSEGIIPIPGGPKDSLNKDAAGVSAMMITAQKAAVDADITGLIFDFDEEGNVASVNRKNIFNAKINTPFTDGALLSTAMEMGIQAITRVETGAAMPETEVDNTRKRFEVQPEDSLQVAVLKHNMYRQFIDGTLKLLDPSGRFNEERFQVTLNTRIAESINKNPEIYKTDESVTEDLARKIKEKELLSTLSLKQLQRLQKEEADLDDAEAK